MHAYDQMTEPELRDHLNQVASALTAMLPEGTGFMLHAAPMGERGIAQFVSNVRPDDSNRWMAETLMRRNAGDIVER